MSLNNLFLDSSNQPFKYQTPLEPASPQDGLGWIPLGTLGDSSVGAVAVKVGIEYDKSASSGATTVQPAQGTNAIASAGTPEKLVAASTLASSVEIYGRKSPAVANTGNLYVGFSSTGGQNYRTVPPGTGFTISAAVGQKLDLSTIYVDASNSADVAVYTYIP